MKRNKWQLPIDAFMTKSDKEFLKALEFASKRESRIMIFSVFIAIFYFLSIPYMSLAVYQFILSLVK